MTIVWLEAWHSINVNHKFLWFFLNMANVPGNESIDLNVTHRKRIHSENWHGALWRPSELAMSESFSKPVTPGWMDAFSQLVGIFYRNALELEWSRRGTRTMQTSARRIVSLVEERKLHRLPMPIQKTENWTSITYPSAFLPLRPLWQFHQCFCNFDMWMAWN